MAEWLRGGSVVVNQVLLGGQVALLGMVLGGYLAMIYAGTYASNFELLEYQGYEAEEVRGACLV
jgi:hypothetical protein